MKSVRNYITLFLFVYHLAIQMLGTEKGRGTRRGRRRGMEGKRTRGREKKGRGGEGDRERMRE